MPRPSRKMPLALRRYWAAKRGTKKVRRRRRRGHHIVRRRRRRSHRRHHFARRRRRHHGGGGGRGIMPGRDDLMLAGGAAVLGFLETKAKADDAFIANKVPKFISQLGWMGNTAVALYVADKFFPNRYLKIAKRSALFLAGYQLARKGAAFSSPTEIFSVSGDDEFLSGDEVYLDGATMGALEADAEMSGIPYDDEVEHALAHT
jgi:hypothetical protein